MRHLSSMQFSGSHRQPRRSQQKHFANHIEAVLYAIGFRRHAHHGGGDDGAEAHHGVAQADAGAVAVAGDFVAENRVYQRLAHALHHAAQHARGETHDGAAVDRKR